jgi:uncharacterized protein DUF3631/bifunctional DNA primase/polymerase-like protein
VSAPPTETAPLVEWALWYAVELCWPVFPCQPRGKEPLTDHGWRDASLDEGQIRAWWAEWPDANIGSPFPSVLDCDLPRDSYPADGVNAYRHLEKKHGVPVGAAIAKSGAGGLHVYFAPGAAGGSVGPGLSMRGEGLYAILPPSVHACGGRYRWERPPLVDRPLPPVPSWLAKKQKTAKKKLTAKVFDTAEKIPVNQRHDAIAAYIGGLRRRNPQLGEEEALVLAHAFRETRCEAPEEKVGDVDDLIAYVYAKEPPEGEEPWTGEMPDGAELLAEIEAYLGRYMRMTEEELVVVALFVVLSYCFSLFEITCYLRVFSATKRCGKSRLLDVLEMLVHAPLPSGGMSEAALFRSLDAKPRTVLFDEIGKVLGEAQRDKNSDLARVFLNGYTVGKPVQRVVGIGTEQQVRDFRVFGPKVLAGTGQLDDQILDRCFPIELLRKKRNEPIQRFRRRNAKQETSELRARIAAWVDAHTDRFRQARPNLPDELDDRGQDIAEPLLVIADVAGGDWPIQARAACIALRGGSDEIEEDIGVELLTDIRAAFGEEERMATEELLRLLADDQERPWARWSKGLPMNARQLSSKLRPFGVKAKQLWIAGANVRGYERASFEDAFTRYAPSGDVLSARPARPQEPSHKQADFDVLGESIPSGSKNGAKPHEQTVLAVLADRKRENGRIPLPGDDDFIALIAEAHRDGHLTEAEAKGRWQIHKLIERDRDDLFPDDIPLG